MPIGVEYSGCPCSVSPCGMLLAPVADPRETAMRATVAVEKRAAACAGAVFTSERWSTVRAVTRHRASGFDALQAHRAACKVGGAAWQPSDDIIVVVEETGRSSTGLAKPKGSAELRDVKGAARCADAALSLCVLLDAAAEGMGDELVAEADAEDRPPFLVQPLDRRLERRNPAVLIVRRGRAAGNDKAVEPIIVQRIKAGLAHIELDDRRLRSN